MKLQLSPLHQNARRASASRQHKLCAAAYHAYAAQIYNPVPALTRKWSLHNAHIGYGRMRCLSGRLFQPAEAAHSQRTPPHSDKQPGGTRGTALAGFPARTHRASNHVASTTAQTNSQRVFSPGCDGIPANIRTDKPTPHTALARAQAYQRQGPDGQQLPSSR